MVTVHKYALLHFVAVESWPLYGLMLAMTGGIDKAELLAAVEIRQRMDTDLGPLQLSCTEKLACVKSAILQGTFTLEAEYPCANGNETIPKQHVNSSIAFWIGVLMFIGIMSIRTYLYFKKFTLRCSFENGEYLTFTEHLHNHCIIRWYYFAIVLFPCIITVAALINVAVVSQDVAATLKWLVSVLANIAVGVWSAITLFSKSNMQYPAEREAFSTTTFRRSWKSILYETNSAFTTRILLAVARSLAGEMEDLQKMVKDEDSIQQLLTVYRQEVQRSRSSDSSIRTVSIKAASGNKVVPAD